MIDSESGDRPLEVLHSTRAQRASLGRVRGAAKPREWVGRPRIFPSLLTARSAQGTRNAPNPRACARHGEAARVGGGVLTHPS